MSVPIDKGSQENTDSIDTMTSEKVDTDEIDESEADNHVVDDVQSRLKDMSADTGHTMKTRSKGAPTQWVISEIVDGPIEDGAGVERVKCRFEIDNSMQWLRTSEVRVTAPEMYAEHLSKLNLFF